MGTGRTFYSCRCGGEIMVEWDDSTNYIECNNCSDPKHLPYLYIIGKAGSGKDFITDLIKELYPNYKSVAIADPLYCLVECLKNDDKQGFRFILEDLGLEQYQSYMAWKKVPRDIIEEIKNPTITKPRKALQVLGDIVRSYHEYPLIIKAIAKAMGSPTIISDVRLPLEGEYLNKVGFVGVKVFADYDIRIERLQDRDKILDISRLEHKTETEIDKIPFDYLIDNTIGEMEGLEERIKDIIRGA